MTSTQITNCEHITYNAKDAQRLDRFQLADLGVNGRNLKAAECSC